MNPLERILCLIDKQCNSDAEFERNLDLKAKTVDSWRRKKSESFYKMLLQISDFFNVSTDYLLGKTDNPTPINKILGTTPIESARHTEKNEQLNVNNPVLEKFNALNTIGQIKAESYIDGLLENPYYKSTDISSSSEPEYVNTGRAIAYGGMVEETKLTAEQDKRLHELLRKKKKEKEHNR